MVGSVSCVPRANEPRSFDRKAIPEALRESSGRVQSVWAKAWNARNPISYGRMETAGSPVLAAAESLKGLLVGATLRNQLFNIWPFKSTPSNNFENTFSRVSIPWVPIFLSGFVKFFVARPAQRHQVVQPDVVQPSIPQMVGSHSPSAVAASATRTVFFQSPPSKRAPSCGVQITLITISATCFVAHKNPCRKAVTRQ